MPLRCVRIYRIHGDDAIYVGDGSTGSEVRTMKVIDKRHKHVKGYREFTEIILFMWETGRQVDR